MDVGIVATLVIGAVGLVAWLTIRQLGLGERTRNNIFTHLFARFEGPFVALLLLTGLAVGVLVAVTQRRRATVVTAPLRDIAIPSRRAVAWVALVAFAVSLATTHLAFRGFLFSMDEYSSDFQARIFAHGQATAELRAPWRSIGRALTPTFVFFDEGTGRWMSQYLPGYALLKAPFVAVHAGTLLNPLLAALAIVCMAGVARRLWPGDGFRHWVAIGLLATSSQFIITSGTGYSMPAHLALNLLWLWLYLRGDARSWAAALGVGALALVLHSPFPHALFVAPFLVRLVRERRWARLASAAAVYGAVGVAALAYLRYVHPDEMATGGLVALFAWPTSRALFVHGVNVVVLFSWQAPVACVLAFAALARARGLSPALVDLALGLALTLAFFTCFPMPQGHGWGYRYAYQVIGNLLLLAAAGAEPLRAALGDRRARGVVAAGLAVGAVIQLPVRLVETAGFVGPFAAADAFVQSRPERVVVVRGDSLWYGADLVRNDPYLERGSPLVLRARWLAPNTTQVLQRLMPGRVVEMSDDELARRGSPRAAFVTRSRPPVQPIGD